MKIIRTFITLSLIFFWLPLSFAQEINSHAFETGSLYIKFKSETSLKSAAMQQEEVNIRQLPLNENLIKLFVVNPTAYNLSIGRQELTNGLFQIEVDESRVEEAISELQKNPEIEYVEKVPRRKIHAHTQATYNDPFYGTVDGLNIRWHWDLINAEKALALQSGSPKIKVAVVDNAVWGNHEDYDLSTEHQYNVHTGDNNSSPVGIDNSSDCTADQVSDNVCLSFNWSHGTHCAGLIAAKNNNGTGIVSLGSGSTLIGVSCGVDNGIYTDKTARGIKWAINQKAKVINCSFGSYEYSQAEQDMITAAIAEGVVIVASAGNESTTNLSYPAAYQGVISVGSCDQNMERTEFSNYGNTVSILAPGGYDEQGVEIFSSTYARNTMLRLYGYTAFEGKFYDMMAGTSMASPIVSSLCALMLAKDSTLTAYDIRSILMNTAQPSLLSGIIENSGVIDAEAAIKAIDTYERPLKVQYLKDFSVDKPENTLLTRLSWNLESSLENKPQSLRIYKNNVLMAFDLDNTLTSFIDSTSLSGGTNYYEICEVYNDIESYKLGCIFKAPNIYNVHLTAEPIEAGMVFGSGHYEHGEWADLVAKPNKGWSFSYWRLSGEPFSERDSLHVRVGSDVNMQAVFVRNSDNEELSAQDFRIYPNPATSEIHVESNVDVAIRSCQIFQNDGRCLLRSEGNFNSINVSSLSPGLYFIRINTEQGAFVQKFIKR